MSVSEDTAKRIADALERLAKVMEGDPVIPPMPQANPDPNRCVMCGFVHGPYIQCPKFVPRPSNGDWP